MIITHKFLDALRQLPGAEKRLDVIPHETEERTRLHLDLLIEGLEVAEKFDFGDLHLEKSGDAHILPALTQDEWEAWREGLLPLPAPVCWYEFTIGSTRSGLLVTTTDSTALSVARLDWVDPVLVSGLWLSIEREDPGSFEELHINMHGNTRILRQERAVVQEMRRIDGPMVLLALYLTLMINSRTTATTIERAPERLNKARMKRGVTPLSAHRVVRIIPESYLRQQRAEAGLQRLPPRMHWRRSHIRTLHRGQLGERRILIPRFLVSKAAEAEVSHEYRVSGT